MMQPISEAQVQTNKFTERVMQQRQQCPRLHPAPPTPARGLLSGWNPGFLAKVKWLQSTVRASGPAAGSAVCADPISAASGGVPSPASFLLPRHTLGTAPSALQAAVPEPVWGQALWTRLLLSLAGLLHSLSHPPPRLSPPATPS